MFNWSPCRMMAFTQNTAMFNWSPCRMMAFIQNTAMFNWSPCRMMAFTQKSCTFVPLILYSPPLGCDFFIKGGGVLWTPDQNFLFVKMKKIFVIIFLLVEHVDPVFAPEIHSRSTPPDIDPKLRLSVLPKGGGGLIAHPATQKWSMASATKRSIFKSIIAPPPAKDRVNKAIYR